MRVTMASIQRDTSIQCRAEIDMGVVNDYADRMAAGDKFPPVELFGTAAQSWPGDGWHRIMAAESTGAKTIEARLHKGGRAEALKHALGANALHGHRRSNADKRRCVEIALAEFPKLSTAKLSKLCGVSRPFVESLRPQDATVASSPRTGSDGKQYPARRAPAETEEPRKEREPRPTEESRELGPPMDGLGFAENAILDLEQIRPEDAQRKQAWALVRSWLDEHE